MTDRMLGSRDRMGFPLLDYFNSLGIRDEDVTIVYACGMHPYSWAQERFGPELLSRVKMIEHVATDDSQQTFVGVTSRGTPVWINRVVVEADIRIGLGEISPVGPAGWCGGGKIILPGCAGRDTIEHNHRMSMSPHVRVGTVETNPVRLDIEEAADLARLDMKIDLLVNTDERIVDVYAGDFRKEWRAGLVRAKEIWTTPMEPTDVSISYPGEGREMYLGTTMYLAPMVAETMSRPGGASILSLSAAGGWESRVGPDLKDVYGPSEDMFRDTAEHMARRMVRSQGNIRSLHIAYMAKVVLERKPVFLHCDGYADAEARALGFAGSSRSLDEAIAMASDHIGVNKPTLSVSFPRGIQWRIMPRVGD
jgi:hypothetical protein